MRQFDNFFNATMSYRSDSQFFMPYGSIIQNRITQYYDDRYREDYYKMGILQKDLIKYENLEDEILDDYVDSLPKVEKDLGAIAIVSNCRAQFRIKTLTYLGKHIKFPNGTKAFDAFGGCNNRIQPISTENMERLRPYLKQGFWSTTKISRH